jgi:DNA-binding XRE family transcriptional regulator
MKNNLKKIRLQNEISQEKLARIVDVSLTTIQNIENQNSEPKVILAIKIKKALNCKTVEELFNED